MTSIPIFLINLDRSTHRLAWCKERVEREGLNLVRVPGVDGTRLSREEIAAVYDPALNRQRYFLPLTSGEIGAYLAHLAAWRRILSDGHEAALVLEDDFACPGSMRDLMRAVQNWPLDYDMLRLYGQPGGPSRHRGFLLPSMAIKHAAVASLRFVAQVVTRRGAEKLLSSMLPIARPVDVEVQFWWQHNLVLQNAVPAPITTETELHGRSEVQFGQPKPVGDKVRRELARPVFRTWLNLLSRIHWMRISR